MKASTADLLLNLPTPAGNLILGANDSALTLCDWARSSKLYRHIAKAQCSQGGKEIINAAAAQLREYFSGTRRDFDIPLSPAGTEFQMNVWNALNSVPYGATATYSEIAALIGSPHSTRAVAAAIAANPISIFLPCHRIIGADGSLTGYAGGLEAKKVLLAIEGGKH